jgi:hypothetical protein
MSLSTNPPKEQPMNNKQQNQQQETKLVAPLPTQEKEMNEHKNVYVALMAAQAEMGPLIKGEKNPHFRSNYAGLHDVVQAVRVALNNNGLAFFHKLVEGDTMRTVLAHGESETYIECDVPLIVDKQNMQGMKSATTYAKRIGLESVTGVAPEDDDGNAAADAPPPKKRQPTPEETAAAKQKERAGSLAAELKAIGTVEGIKSFWDDNVDEIKTFPQVTQDYLQKISDSKEAEFDEPPFQDAAE